MGRGIWFISFALLLIPGIFAEFDKAKDRSEWLEKWIDVMKEIEANPEARKEMEERVARDWNDDWKVMLPEFKCNLTKPGSAKPVPTSVHELHPSDISVVGSWGDSITAGNGIGATWIAEVALENRGESWCIGGEYDYPNEQVLTLPNILKIFNPELTGQAKCAVQEKNKLAWLNQAQPGGKANWLDDQSHDLVRLMKEDDKIDYENDWKMITLFIGGNDLCIVCEPDEWEQYKPEVYTSNIEKAIDILYYDPMPKTIINIVSMFDITPLDNMSTGIVCDLAHWGFCGCAKNESKRTVLKDIQLQYWNLTTQLVESGKYDNRSDFTVVVHPHMRDMVPPTDPETGGIDFNFLGPDCFHPGRKGHAGFAFMLWNVLLTPVGHKPFVYDLYSPDQQFYCPTEEHPYIFTNINSEGVDWPPGQSKGKEVKKAAKTKGGTDNSALPKPELFKKRKRKGGPRRK